MKHVHHEKHECPGCAAVYRCKPMRELRRIKGPCKSAYYFHCPECVAAGATEVTHTEMEER